jgi:predicted  nucleic acid-binding Zn-ribbon protein
MREEEIVALSEASRIISSSTVAGAGATHLPAFLQTKARSALAQMEDRYQNPAQERAAAFLTERADGSGSRLLRDAARRLASNPFEKVKKMIKDLIVNLMEEATSETEHKGWCDSELVANKISRESRTADVNQLNADIEDLTAEIAQLTEDVAQLSKAIKELDEAMVTAQQDRASSKAANDQTTKEAQEAQSAVEEATALLKDYYAKSAQATALVQQTPLDDAPDTFEKPYQGMLTEGGNVLSFLEVILSDFARLESETIAAEEREEDEHKQFMFESKKDKALKETDVKHKSARKTDKESALHSAQSELKATQGQLDKAIAYYEKLKPSCVDSGITYEDRVKKREEEIQSLQEALQILTGQDLPTLA